MARMKTFGIYALIIIVFFLFSNVMINIAMKTTYGPIDYYLLAKEGQDFTIEEAKATYVNGVIKGKLKNNTNLDMANKYIRIDVYTSRNNILGSKYIPIQNLKVGQEQEFSIGFQFTNADKCVLGIVDKGQVDTTNKALFTSEELGRWAIMKLIVFMMLPI